MFSTIIYVHIICSIIFATFFQDISYKYVTFVYISYLIIFIFFYFLFYFIFLKYLYLFIYFWLCWVFVSVRWLSLVVASGGHSSSRCMGLLLSWPLLLRSTGSRRAGSVIVAHGPSCSHEPQLLSPHATTTEARVSRVPAPQLATAMRSPRTKLKSSPRSPQLEKARTQQRRPNTAKNK